MYRILEPDKAVDTIAKLSRRIEERFPGSKLREVCDELLAVATEAKARAAWITRPLYGLRAAVIALITISTAAIGYSVWNYDGPERQYAWGDFFVYVDAGINNLLFIGAASFFLLTIEVRIKRRRAQKALHELKAIAHIVDLHQLTKDPHAVFGYTGGVITPSSPKRDMTAFELIRYLEYCSEILALTGKVAAVYGQSFRDSVSTSAANEVESLTTGLSQKVWQKLVILHAAARGAPGSDRSGLIV